MQKKKLKQHIKDFLMQGSSPTMLAAAAAGGFMIGTFPILGTHTVLALALVLLFGVNPAAIFLFSNVFFPLYFLLLWPSYTLGVFLTGSSTVDMQAFLHVNFSDILNKDFFQTIGFALLHVLLGWVLFALPLASLIFGFCKIVFLGIKKKIDVVK